MNPIKHLLFEWDLRPECTYHYLSAVSPATTALRFILAPQPHINAFKVWKVTKAVDKLKPLQREFEAIVATLRR